MKKIASLSRDIGLEFKLENGKIHVSIIGEVKESTTNIGMLLSLIKDLADVIREARYQEIQTLYQKAKGDENV